MAALLVLGSAAPLLAQSPAGSGATVDNARQILGAPRGPALGGAALETETKRVALLLRCPVCQGLSVAESPSSMALNMRDEVRELVAAGYDEEQVLRYFERSYGEFVRLEPPLRGVNWIVWLAPVAGLLAGAGIVAWTLRRPRPSAAPVQASAGVSGPAEAGVASAEPATDPELQPYLLRVRELAYGWPGGVEPGRTPAPEQPPA